MVRPSFSTCLSSAVLTHLFPSHSLCSVDVCAKASNNPSVYIAETGWPTASMNASSDVNGANSPASITGLQVRLLHPSSFLT